MADPSAEILFTLLLLLSSQYIVPPSGLTTRSVTSLPAEVVRVLKVPVAPSAATRRTA